MTEFVVDCSVTMAWCFPDEATAAANAILDALRTGRAQVPVLWPLEVANVLLINERRNRLTTAEADAFLVLLSGLSIAIERETTEQLLKDTIDLARAHRLTTYDAAYLELAVRKSLPLCTYDGELQRAAAASGVPLFSV